MSSTRLHALKRNIPLELQRGGPVIVVLTLNPTLYGTVDALRVVGVIGHELLDRYKPLIGHELLTVVHRVVPAILTEVDVPFPTIADHNSPRPGQMRENEGMQSFQVTTLYQLPMGKTHFPTLLLS